MADGSTEQIVRDKSYSGYQKRNKPAVDPELTRVGPGTPMGEYMRKFWNPVCLSVELTDVPKAIRILGENLVAFRDKSGRVGVLHRQCSHRGASLEYGMITERGLRCCYHGWLYDVDGTILETPCEPPTSTVKDRLCHGAYPAFEKAGLVFAYMGPMDRKPEFPEFDCYTLPRTNKLVPFSNIYPCNWLQVAENIMDHMHAYVLHNNMVADGVSEQEAARMNLEGLGILPVIRWETTHDGNGIAMVAGRRVDEKKIHIRINSGFLPGLMFVGSPTAQASRTRHSTVGNNRWHTPVDDEHMIIFGYREFNDEVDPEHVGNEAELGVDKFDFLDGQVGNRPYEVGQRAPGDWEALTSIGPIAVHGIENPVTSDVGVMMYRKLLRAAVRGETPKNAIHEKQRTAGQTLHVYTQDSVLHVPERPGEDDKALLMKMCREVLNIMKEGDDLPTAARDDHIRRRLNELAPGSNLPMRGPQDR